MGNNFHREIYDFIIERMYDYEGMEFYACDLANKLTMAENYTGTYIIGTYAAREFIREHFDEAGECFTYYHEELGMNPNPFTEPEAFTFFMLDWGVSELMAGCTYLDEHWDERITLDREAIEAIMENL